MKTAWKSCLLIGAFCSAIGCASGQSSNSADATHAMTAAPVADQPLFKQEELDQMLASIALYPDSLLSQVLMASTYPIEIVEADRWVKAHPDLAADALAAELEKQPWDASVKSLVNFPDVLSMMSENLSTTVKIGDAFIGQQKEVMQSVQKLRAKAKETGNLASTPQQNVTTVTQGGTQVIVIEPASPEVIYVPQYNPTVVYGGWWYPAYPPYPYYPRGYVYGDVFSFGIGIGYGVAWGYAWGGCNWGHWDVDIDCNRNVHRNHHIDRGRFADSHGGAWRHDPVHRHGVAYRNQDSAHRVGAGPTATRASQARQNYRGKAEAGRTDIARRGADSVRRDTPTARPGQAPSRTGQPSTRTGQAPTRTGQPSTRTAQPSTRTARPAQAPSRGTGTVRGGDTRSSTRGGAMSGASRGGNAARQSNSRGSASRSASPSPRAAPSRSSGSSRSTGASRSGSGGSRSGGTRGGGR